MFGHLFRKLLVIAVVIPLLLKVSDLENFEYHPNDKVYDLKTLTGPIVSGFPLQIFTRLLDFRPFAAVFIPHLLKDNEFPVVSRFAETLDVMPTYYPLVPPTAEQISEAQEAKLDLSVFQEALEKHPRESPVHYLTAEDYVALYRTKATTPTKAMKALIELIKKSHKDLLSFTQVDEDDILKQAEASTKRYAENKAIGLLDGVPIGVKEEFDVKGYATTIGTKFLNKKVEKDAEVVTRFRAQGAIIVGKTNMHEFGMGTTGLNPHHGTPRNPFNPNHHTGGSSSGSAAVVGSGLVPIAIAADGGGSIRIPASFCGSYGIKSTFARVSENGAAPICWSVAHVGPIAATPRDLALAYAVMAGPDVHDQFSLIQPPVTLKNFFESDLKGLKIGVFKEHFEDAEPLIVEANRAALRFLESNGAKVVPITLPPLNAIYKAHALTILSEMATNIHEHRDHFSELSLEVQINLHLTRHFTSRDYIAAQKIRSWALSKFKEVYSQIDVIASPSTANFAPALVNGSLSHGLTDIETTTKSMRYAALGNFIGLPAISIPIGQDPVSQLPIGLQLMGNFWQEHKLLQIANLFAEYSASHLSKPKLSYKAIN